MLNRIYQTLPDLPDPPETQHPVQNRPWVPHAGSQDDGSLHKLPQIITLILIIIISVLLHRRLLLRRLLLRLLRLLLRLLLLLLLRILRLLLILLLLLHLTLLPHVLTKAGEGGAHAARRPG